MFQQIHRSLIILTIFLVGCREVIIHDVDEKEANRIIVSLHNAGFTATKTPHADGKWGLSVPKSESIFALQYISHNKLYSKDTNSVKKPASIFNSSSQVSQELARSLADELEGTLTTLDQVLTAKVHLNLAVQDLLLTKSSSKGTAGSASVFILTNAVESIIKEDIQKLVSGASGIPEKRVNVLINQTSNKQSVSSTDQLQDPSTANIGISIFKESTDFVSYGIIGFAIFISLISYLSWKKRNRVQKLIG